MISSHDNSPPGLQVPYATATHVHIPSNSTSCSGTLGLHLLCVVAAPLACALGSNIQLFIAAVALSVLPVSYADTSFGQDRCNICGWYSLLFMCIDSHMLDWFCIDILIHASNPKIGIVYGKHRCTDHTSPPSSRFLPIFNTCLVSSLYSMGTLQLRPCLSPTKLPTSFKQKSTKSVMQSTHNIVSFTPHKVTLPVHFNIFIIRCCTGKVHNSLGMALPAAVDASEDA